MHLSRQSTRARTRPPAIRHLRSGPAEPARGGARPGERRARRRAGLRRQTELRRDPDRRPDARRPLRDLPRLRRSPGDAGDAEHARPDRQARHDLQPLLRLLSPLLPLAGQPADRPLRPQPRTSGATSSPTAATRASPSARPSPTTSPSGCSRPATRRSTSASSSTATATAPYDNGEDSAARLELLAHGPQAADTTHYYYGYTLNNNGSVDGPYGDSGSWETREYGVRDDPGCPFAPINGLPCYYETDTLTTFATNELAQTPAEQPFYLQLDYTAPHGDYRRPAGPEPAPREYDWFKGARLPHDRSEGFDEGNVADKPRFIREAPHLTLDDKHTYRVYWQKQLESLRSDRRRRQADRRHAGRRGSPPQHLHHLHLRQRLLLRRAPPDRRQVPRLRAGHAPPLPDPRPRHQAGHLDRRAERRTSTSRRRSSNWPAPKPTRASTAARWSPSSTTRPCAAGGRCSSSPSSRPTTSNRAGARSTPARTTRAGAVARRAVRGATASLLAPPKDYEGIRLGPYKYIAWPDGEKELYDINRDPNELNNIAKIPNFFPIRNFLHEELRRLEDCVGRECREPAPKLPLTRKEFAAPAQTRKAGTARRTQGTEGKTRRRTAAPASRR